jgi:hypothetical protein
LNAVPTTPALKSLPKHEFFRRRFLKATLPENVSPTTPLICDFPEKNATRSDMKEGSAQPSKRRPHRLLGRDFATKIFRLDKCYIPRLGLVNPARTERLLLGLEQSRRHQKAQGNGQG